MEDNSPHDLNVERVQPQDPLGPFPGHRKGFGQQVIQIFSLFLNPLFKFRCLRF